MRHFCAHLAYGSQVEFDSANKTINNEWFDYED